jgi:hypothetical protein
VLAEGLAERAGLRAPTLVHVALGRAVVDLEPRRVAAEAGRSAAMTDQRNPRLGLRPTMLLRAAGTRPEPAVSVPSASGTMPRATATADPELEPPGIRSGRSGLRGMP